MPKTQTQTTEEEEQDTGVDSNAEAPKGKTGSDPADLPTEEADASAADILTAKEAQNEFFKDMADFTDEVDEEDFVEGGEAKKPVVPPVAKTPAEVAAEAAAAQSALEASNVAKGLNADGTAKEPTPQVQVPVAPELDAEGKPIVTPPVQVQPPVQPIEQPTGEQPPTPEQITEYYRTWRGNTEKVLAETHYKLSQEQVDELDADPVAALPKFMAKVYLDAVTATLAQMNAHLPRMVGQINAASKDSEKREMKFYEKWPSLNTEENQKVVLRLGSAYKTSNPTATVEQFIDEVGAQAMVTLRLPMPMQANGNGNVPPPAKPFKPAASTPPSTGASPPPKNAFEAFNDTFDEDIEEE